MKLNMIALLFFVIGSTASANDVIFDKGHFDQDAKLAFTSFEEPKIIIGENSGKYNDKLGQDAHDLVNNDGQAPVDTIGLVTKELGFDARFKPYADPMGAPGLTDGDFVGVSSFSLNLTDVNDVSVGGFSHGVQGYQMSDPDGTMIIESTEVDLTGRTNNSITVDFFLDDRSHFDNPPDAGDWEVSDSFIIKVLDVTNNTEIEVVNLKGGVGGIDSQNPSIEYKWNSAVKVLPDNIKIKVVIEFTADSSREVVYIDNIEIRGL